MAHIAQNNGELGAILGLMQNKIALESSFSMTFVFSCICFLQITIIAMKF